MAKTVVYHCDNCGEQMPTSNRYRIIIGSVDQMSEGKHIIDKELCYNCERHIQAVVSELQEKRLCYSCERLDHRQNMESVNGIQFYCIDCISAKAR